MNTSTQVMINKTILASVLCVRKSLPRICVIGSVSISTVYRMYVIAIRC